MSLPILIINTGSSSIKFSVIDVEQNRLLLHGLVEKLGMADAVIHIKKEEEKRSHPLTDGSHEAGMQAILQALQQEGLQSRLKAVGHRVVHGGDYFKSSTLITPKVIEAIEHCVPFAPLHNPANLIGIRAAMQVTPELPHIAVFDTAFHQTIPEHAYLYAVPKQWYRQHGVRRYGFHGTSHRFVSETAIQQLGLDPNNNALIIAHLGNGASATAILNGKSVDTSMGFTPLEGLVMGTRSGDIDPGLPPYIAGALKVSDQEIVNILNKQSGLLGISELSSDMRELSAAADEGHAGATLAIQIFVHRLARYIGALATSLPRIDALVFTGGIGENAAPVRAMVLNHLQVFGFQLDAAKNNQTIRGEQGIISLPNSPIAMVISTNEELMIAKESASLLNN